jgi:hypothetical protein
MSRQKTVPVRGVGVQIKQLYCRFRPDTASDPSTIYGQGVLDVTHLTTGRWTVSFNEAALRCLAIIPGVEVSTSSNDYAITCTPSNEGTTTPLSIVVTNNVGGTPTDIASHTQNWISLVVVVEESSAAV